MHSKRLVRFKKCPNKVKKKIVAEIPLSSFCLGHLLLCVEVCPDVEHIYIYSARDPFGEN